MTIKLELTIDELDILVTSMEEELENAKECGDTFIRMTELPKELQDKYINYKRKTK